jgi:transposase-like protein
MALESRLLAGESYRRVASAFGLSESSLRRHRNAHMQSAQQQPTAAPKELDGMLNADTRADGPASVRGSLAEQVAAQDRQLQEIAFRGGTLERVRMVEAHLTAVMRRAEARDPRTALAAAKLILQAHELEAKLSGDLNPDAAAGRATAIVVIQREGEPLHVPPTIEGEARTIVVLPDNGRGDGDTAE